MATPSGPEGRRYCKHCGQVLVMETSLYYLNFVNVLCYNCNGWEETIEAQNHEEAQKMCADYWMLIHKTRPVTSAQLKEGQQRRRRFRIRSNSLPSPDRTPAPAPAPAPAPSEPIAIPSGGGGGDKQMHRRTHSGSAPPALIGIKQ